MKNWISKLDEYLALLGKGVLKNAGIISADKAEEKANREYEIYKKTKTKIISRISTAKLKNFPKSQRN